MKLEQNVNVFDNDIDKYGGYQYTDTHTFSAKVSNQRISDMIHKLIPPNTQSILDFGCGDGTYTALIKNQFPQAKVSGFDPAKKAIACAKEKHTHIHFYIGDLLDAANIEKEIYDVGVLRGVIHHLQDPALAIQNALSIAKELIIIEPNGNNPILKGIERKSKYHIAHEERSFSFNYFSQLISTLGAEIIFKKYIGYVPFFCPELPARIIYLLQPLLERIPGFRTVFAGQIVLVVKKKSDTGTL